MTTLIRGRPLTTRAPALSIDAGLAPGNHRFQLEVVGSSGLRSRPDAATVVVLRRVIGLAPAAGPPGVVAPRPATPPEEPPR